MKNIHNIRKIFVRQLNESDCGIACLSMVLNYAGQKNDAQAIRYQFTILENGVSLLQLKKLAGECHQEAKCVQMNTNHLRQAQYPCILHMVTEAGNNHFQVCFGSVLRNRSYFYLMADPAHQVHYLPEDELLNLWKSQTALIFKDLTERIGIHKVAYWNPLITVAKFPKWLILSFALISIATAIFGIALTWVLQNGINDPLAGKKGNVVFATVILLLIISLFKNLLGYIKQQIMVTVSLQINEQLTLKILSRVYSFSKLCYMQVSPSAIKKLIGDVQKIQNAIALLLGTIVADGTLILFCIIGLYYVMPVAVIPNLISVTIALVVSLKHLPSLIYQNSHLNGLAGIFEKSLLNIMQSRQEKGTDPLSEAKQIQIESHQRYIHLAKAIANKLGRINLITECIGTLNVITVIAIGLTILRKENTAYTSFMLAVVLTFYATTLTTKITSTLYAITDGSDSAIQLSNCGSN